MFDEDYQQSEETTAPPFDWRNVVYMLLENYRLITFCLVIAVVLTTIYLTRAPTVYAATGVLKYEPAQLRGICHGCGKYRSGQAAFRNKVRNFQVVT